MGPRPHASTRSARPATSRDREAFEAQMEEERAELAREEAAAAKRRDAMIAAVSSGNMKNDNELIARSRS